VRLRHQLFAVRPFDSHALFWFLDGDARLSDAAPRAIEESEAIVYVSAVTAFEIEGVPPVTADAVFGQFNVRTLW
jgi:hypothetical protein